MDRNHSGDLESERGDHAELKEPFLEKRLPDSSFEEERHRIVAAFCYLAGVGRLATIMEHLTCAVFWSFFKS